MSEGASAPLVVVMGVSGCGKSAVGARLAERIGCGFVDADDLHPRANVEKMAAGVPLTDEERGPWLAAVGDRIASARRAGEGLVVACSALRRAYRDAIRDGEPSVRFVHLDGSRDLFASRLGSRAGHFMPASLLDSQLAALDPLGDDDAGFTVSVDRDVTEIVAEVMRTLGAVSSDRVLGVGVVGFGWMGQVHARAYARLRHHYPGLSLRTRLVAVADPAADRRLDDAMRDYGFQVCSADWRDVIGRPDVDVVSVTGPNFIHREVAVAAAEAGKHVWAEKPVGRHADETRAVADAVHAAGVQSAVGFNYRNAPAVELARELIDAGRLGRVEQVDVRMLADYSAHPSGALSWRFETARAGSGVLGDLVCHGIDLARFVVGDVTELVADDATFIAERPRATDAASHFARAEGGELTPVENEDYASALLRFAGGARGTLVASRVAVGEQCTYGIEVHGDQGALAWDFRRMGELRLCVDQDYQDAAWQTRLVGPGTGELAAFQPGSGIAMGYDDLKVIEAARFVRSIAEGKPYGATVDDAVAAADAVAAIQSSVRERRWVELSEPASEPFNAATFTAAASDSETKL